MNSDELIVVGFQPYNQINEILAGKEANIYLSIYEKLEFIYAKKDNLEPEEAASLKGPLEFFNMFKHTEKIIIVNRDKFFLLKNFLNALDLGKHQRYFLYTLFLSISEVGTTFRDLYICHFMNVEIAKIQHKLIVSELILSDDLQPKPEYVIKMEKAGLIDIGSTPYTTMNNALSEHAGFLNMILFQNLELIRENELALDAKEITMLLEPLEFINFFYHLQKTIYVNLEKPYQIISYLKKLNLEKHQQYLFYTFFLSDSNNGSNYELYAIRHFMLSEISKLKSGLIIPDLLSVNHRLPTTKEEVEENHRFNLSSKRGAKIDFIRILNSLYELKFFELKNGQIPNKKEFMVEVGKFFGVELSEYHADLSQALKNGSTESNIKIFEEMKKVIQKKVNE